MFGANDTRNTAVVAFGEKKYQQDITMQKVISLYQTISVFWASKMKGNV